MPSGRAVTRIKLEAEAGSVLSFTEGPTILQAGANYEQHVEIVAGGGLVAYAEIVVLGRLASGEHATFARYTSEIVVIDQERQPLYVERFSLTATDRTNFITAAAPVMAKILLVGAHAAPPSLADIADNDSLYAGIDALPNAAGVAVRLLSNRLEPAVGAVESVVSSAIPALTCCHSYPLRGDR
jgi:urease accessory protein UreH